MRSGELKKVLLPLRGVFLKARLALASILVWSTFGEIHSRYPPRFIYALFIWGYWNFRLEFVMPYTSQYTRDVPSHLSYEYGCHLITGFPFALVFTCTFTEFVT